MSELFDQFVVEAQELLETAGAALLALERDPADRASVDELFRAFHTLKGASALFDMAPFTRLVHAGEDTLSLLRDGRRGMTPELADRLFRALDQCARWVAALEGGGTLPADAAEAAETLVRGLAGGDAAGAASAGGEADSFPWVATLTETERRTAGEGRLTVIDYTPDPECFFTGDDPLALFRRVSDLRLLRIEPVEPLPPLAQMDPYRCVLRFRALSGAAAEAVTPVFRSVPDQVRIGSVTLASAIMPPAAAPPGSLAATMLEEQARILALPGLRLISLQYDDCEAELADAERRFGIAIHRPPLDLKNDLDGAAALTAALDLVLSAGTSVAEMAGALGVPVWRIGPAGDWTALGTGCRPWYPSMRLFSPKAGGTLGDALGAAGRALMDLRTPEPRRS